MCRLPNYNILIVKRFRYEKRENMSKEWNRSKKQAKELIYKYLLTYLLHVKHLSFNLDDI